MNPTRGLSCIKRGSYDKSNPAFNNITAGQAKVYLYSDIETYLKGYINAVATVLIIQEKNHL